jgi:hypothetical protein
LRHLSHRFTSTGQKQEATLQNRQSLSLWGDLLNMQLCTSSLKITDKIMQRCEFFFFVAAFFWVIIRTSWHLGWIGWIYIVPENILANYWIMKCLHILLYTKHVITDASRTSLGKKLGISANDSLSLYMLPNLFNKRETKTVRKRTYTI